MRGKLDDGIWAFGTKLKTSNNDDTHYYYYYCPAGVVVQTECVVVTK